MRLPSILELEQLERTGCCAPLRAFVEAFARDGSRTYISNLTTQLVALELDGVIIPMTVNEAEYGQAFTCLPHSAYPLYSKAELNMVDTGLARPIFAAVADAASAVLRAAKVNRVVNVNNWMMSTNLHARWSHGSIPMLRDFLVERFPTHFIAVRSLTRWADTLLISQMEADGWRLIPSRQVFCMDDPHREWSVHRNSRTDLRRIELLNDEIGEIKWLADGDAERISELYQDLYIRKYTPLNPAFTPEFIRMTHAAGVMRYHGTRDSHGSISAVVAAVNDGLTMCPQFIAYDQSRAQSEGLYRVAMAISVMMASQFGMKLNWSAGAGRFKSTRGGKPMVEYTAFYDRHLSSFRRMVLASLDGTVRSFMVPFVQARGL